jgi:hypothetical protein
MTDGNTRTGVSFAYWTAPLYDPAGSTTDLTPEMINEKGKIAPAPCVPFTRAGCDFGAVATANTILENTAIDILLYSGPVHPRRRRSRPILGKPSRTSSALACIARRAQPCARHRPTHDRTCYRTSPAAIPGSTVFSARCMSIPSSSPAAR